jgi:3-vinyl bacteriochlorophyllide hydratase
MPRYRHPGELRDVRSDVAIAPHRQSSERQDGRLSRKLDISGGALWTSHGSFSADSRSQGPAIYSPAERARRDRSPWTLVQGVLAPVQFAVFLVSAGLVIRFLATGEGYAAATASIVVKTMLLYAIMVTGSLWEKDVFGRYLFAPAFFWEDLVSLGVIALHTGYLYVLITGALDHQAQMMLALAAYAAYVVNAGQFLLKLRAARRQTTPPAMSFHQGVPEGTRS